MDVTAWAGGTGKGLMLATRDLDAAQSWYKLFLNEHRSSFCSNGPSRFVIVSPQKYQKVTLMGLRGWIQKERQPSDG